MMTLKYIPLDTSKMAESFRDLINQPDSINKIKETTLSSNYDVHVLKTVNPVI